MGKKVILALLFVFLLFPLVSSIDSGTFKQNEDVLLRANLNGAFVNLTVYYPNSSIAIENESMTNIFGETWSYNFTNTSSLGVYAFDYCDENGSNCVENTFELTTTGFELTEARAIIFIGLLGLLAFLFVVSIFGFSALPSGDTKDQEGMIIDINNLKYVRPVLLVVAWVLLMTMFFIGSNIGFAYLGSTLVANILFDIYKIMMILTLPFMVFWLVWIFVKIFQDGELKKILDRGVGSEQI